MINNVSHIHVMIDKSIKNYFGMIVYIVNDCRRVVSRIHREYRMGETG
jgi:hypothetical protein